MIPKKTSDLYQQLSEDLNLDKHLVESFIDFYYTELRKTMSDLKYPRINVEGLGHFHVKPQIVKKAITSYSRLLENYSSETFNGYHNKKRIANKVELLKNIYVKLEEAKEQKELFKQKKYGKTDTNLEE
jgi:nucleoid DNA-binding protein